MKLLAKARLFALLIFFGCSNFSIAQLNNYSKGMVYINAHDSIEGRIRSRFIFNGGRKINFIGKNGVKQKFKARHIYGYKMDNGGKYLSNPSSVFGGYTIFMKVIEEGPLTLMFYIRIRTNNYGGFVTTTRQIIYYVKRKDLQKKAERVPWLTFRNFMLKYVFDDKEVKELVETRTFRFHDLVDIVRLYNKNQQGR